MSDRRAVVTGAVGGIGAAVADALADDHEVVSHDLRATAERTPTVRSDLADVAGVRALADAAGDEPLDLLVAAHGLGGPGPLPELRPQRVNEVMQVNFELVTELVRTFRPQLAAAEGCAVLVASQAGLTGEAHHAAYCASKFALVGWARAAAADLAVKGIRLRLMCPGCVDTPMLRGAIAQWATDMGGDPHAVMDRRIGQIPRGRLAAPAEIAAGIRFLSQLTTPELVVLNQSGGETFPR